MFFTTTFFASDFAGETVVDQKTQIREPASAPTFGVVEAIHAYCSAQGLATATVASYRTTAAKWLEWSNVHRSCTSKHVRDVSTRDIVDFLDFVIASARDDGDANPENTRNKRRKELHAVFAWLCSFDCDDALRLDALPVFPPKLSQRDVAGLYFLTGDEYTALYDATFKIKTPRKWYLPYSIGPYLRAALVLCRRFAFDTGTLMPFSVRHRDVLLWKNVSTDILPPGRAAAVESPFGHVWFRRQKNQKLFVRPLDVVARAHIDCLRHESISDDDPVLGRRRPGRDKSQMIYWSAGGSRPTEIFQQLVEIAQLPPKVDIESASDRQPSWVWKDVRKTHATDMERHRPGMAIETMGHSRQGVTHRHYANTLPAIYEALLTFPAYPCELRIVPPALRAGVPIAATKENDTEHD